MRLLIFLMDNFVGAFGITKPKPEHERRVALVLGGFLLILFAGVLSLIVWMLYGSQR